MVIATCNVSEWVDMGFDSCLKGLSLAGFSIVTSKDV